MKLTQRKQILVAVALLGHATLSGAQTSSKPKSAPTPAAASPVAPAASSAAVAAPQVAAFTVKVTPQHVATLTAKDAKASDIGRALAQELNVPVRMSAIVAAQKITLKMSQAPVESLLLALAPQVYIDYELRWDRPQEDWVGVELTGFNEREPKTPVEPKAFMVLSGNTEDENVTAETLAKDQAVADEEKMKKDPPKEGPILEVVVNEGLVSIRARQQMAAAILLEMASKAGMGFETRGELDPTLIDVDIRSTPIDQIPVALARPGFGLLMRRNLATAVTRPVAVLLGSDASKVKAPVTK